MNSKELKSFILKEASKYLNVGNKPVVSEHSKKNDKDVNGLDDSAISASDVKLLAEEMKKINKRIDLRNPLINQSFFEKAKEIEQPKLKESKEEKKPLIKESQKKRWQSLYSYDIPKDSKR